MNSGLGERLESLSTPHLADACTRIGIEVRCGPASLKPIAHTMQCAGRVRPARHVGSVDVFLEALEDAGPGDVLVIDNAGRTDQACIGDLVTLEIANAGLSGAIIWGLHRDTPELLEIGLPVFSLGSLPAGPRSADTRPPDALDWAQIGEWTVNADDVVSGDADGVIFLPAGQLAEIVEAAEAIRSKERQQVAQMRAGRSFREQADFAAYVARRDREPRYGFREHLRSLGGAVEE